MPERTALGDASHLVNRQPAPVPAPGQKKPAAASSRKRKLETSLEDDIAAYKRDLSHIDLDGRAIDLSCNQVRSRINKLLDAGIMKKGEFCAAIGSSSNSVNRFLRQTGSMTGAGCDSYGNAWAWFKQRELVGLKMPDVKKRQKTEAAAVAAAAANASGAGPAAVAAIGKKAAAAAAPTVDISNVHLPGEESDDVEVYDSCQEIRKKISAHLKTPGLTQAQFCRDLYAQLSLPQCKSIQSKQLADFRGKDGAVGGARSSVFYAAYVYFEKLRIAQGKPKSAHREAMESIWAHRGGVDRTIDNRTGYFVSAGEAPYMDEYGRIITSAFRGY